MIRRSSLTVSGSSCSSSEGTSSGWRPIQAPTYRFGGSVTLASRRSRKDELETCFEHSLNVLSHKAKTQSNKLSLYNYTYNNGFQCVLVVLSHSRRREFCKRLRVFVPRGARVASACFATEYPWVQVILNQCAFHWLRHT